MSLRKAINAQCKECIYDPFAKGAWRMQVEACPCTGCPLYAVRPRSRAAKSAHNEAVKAGLLEGEDVEGASPRLAPVRPVTAAESANKEQAAAAANRDAQEVER